MPDPDASRIHGLGQLISAAKMRRRAPIDSWNPPYCGDIGLKIHKDGSWSYQGSPIARPELVTLFSTVLRCDADGRHYLVTPVEKVDVDVEDSPFLAVEMQVDQTSAGQQLTFRTNIDDIVVCGPDHPLSFRLEEKSGGLKPYVRVRGNLWARLTRPLYFDLVDLAEAADDNGETFVVQSGGETFFMEPETANR
jgi:uncharacterized protein